MEDLDYTLFDGRVHAPLPRPSRFEVITWQLNVTVYPPGGAIKWTSSIRDPKSAGLIHQAVDPFVLWDAGQPEIIQQCTETMRAIGYMTGLSKGI